MSMLRSGWTVLALALVPPALFAQDAARVAFDSASLAWDAGRYPEALGRLERLLTGPSRDTLRRPIALLTGEYYRTIELAPDGQDLVWSRDGRRLAFGTAVAEVPRTIVLRFGDDGRVTGADTLPGRRAVFSPDGGSIAYLGTSPSADLDSARSLLAATPDGAGSDGARRRQEQQAIVRRLETGAARVVVRTLADGRERVIETPGLGGQALVFAGDGAEAVLHLVASGQDGAPRVYRMAEAGAEPLAGAPPVSTVPLAGVGGRMVYQTGDTAIAIVTPDGKATTYAGASPAISADHRTVVYVGEEQGSETIMLLTLGGLPRAVARTTMPLAGPAVSADGSSVVFQAMPREDWELFVVGADGGAPRRLTHEIQHDIDPQFVGRGGNLILAVIGEGRHRRSYLYDAASGERTRLFHNNTVRTVAPEYEWAVRPDGGAVAIVSDRDGDTVSPEQGVYLTDLVRTVGTEELLDRVRTAARKERDLRARGTAMFAPIAEAVRTATREVSSDRIYRYAYTLSTFDSRFITQPGNAKAIDYLQALLRSWGYEPELQWFEPRPGVRSANVVATLRGTTDPDLEYVVGAHFDSVEDGPGADDNGSGTTQLLEAARVLARRPQRATIKFVWFTGEEAGLRGSREFVRRAVEAKERVRGALNNDMLGWMNDNRLDNTIRYSNAGLRDVQHAAAFLFSDLITYDAHYFKFTDAHSLYDGFGDVVAGIGSYPILGNPHYHQPHDVLETVNQRLVAEVAKTTIASVMLMASSPSRVEGLQASPVQGGGVALTWQPAVEQKVRGYRVRWTPVAGGAERSTVVTAASARIPAPAAGGVIGVRALGVNGTEGWDWTTVAVPSASP
ncbi:MAG TPA: M20/M25/M40 family metallo-hydrolase [Gemmatimonadales bacterium]|nr:M20/M25/M40 family metallo-hydrolase [Gemmatimonadales bacterium]